MRLMRRRTAVSYTHLGIILALLLKSGTMSWPVALLITLLAGVVMGLINAFFVNGIKLMSFITTIAMMSVYMGLARILTNSQNIAIDQKYASFYSVCLLYTSRCV